MNNVFKVSQITIRNEEPKFISADFTIDAPDMRCSLTVRLEKKNYSLKELEQSALRVAIGSLQSLLDVSNGSTKTS